MQFSRQIKNIGLTSIGSQGWEPVLYTGAMPANPINALTGTQVFDTAGGILQYPALEGDSISSDQVLRFAPTPLGLATRSGVPGYMRLKKSGTTGEVIDVLVSSTDQSSPVKSSGLSYIEAQTNGNLWNLVISMIGSDTYVAPANLKRKLTPQVLKNILIDATQNLTYLDLYTGASPGPNNAPTGTNLGSTASIAPITWSAPATTGTEGGFITTATFPQIVPNAPGTVGYARLHDGMNTSAIDLVVGTDIKLSRTSITQAQVDAGTNLTVSTLGTGLPRFALTVTPTNFGVGGGGPYFPCPVIYEGRLNLLSEQADNPISIAGVVTGKNADYSLVDRDPPILATYNYPHRRILERGDPLPRSRQSGISNLNLDEMNLSNYALVLEQFDGSAAQHVWNGSEWQPVIPRLWDGSDWVKRLPVLAKIK